MTRTLLVSRLSILVILGLLIGQAAVADEPGWISLFDGKTLDGWQNAAGKAPGAGWVVQDGTMFRKDKGAGDIWTKARYGDFVLEAEFKTEGNSGIFIRTDKPRDNVQTGIEIQVDRPSTTPNRHSVGAIYDLVTPSKEMTKPGQWNKVQITARANTLQVLMNGELITEMNLDLWTTAQKNPDGTPNKFRTALKDFKREGHIGLQDHGAVVAYRNLRLKPLVASKP
jgi:hypothetical protein